MPPAATRPHVPSTLYLAFEFGNTEWKLAMTTRVDQTPLARTMPARALKTLEAELARRKPISLWPPQGQSLVATKRGATGSASIVIWPVAESPTASSIPRASK
jgi:hypothetical protein